jgi:protein-tyrosine phosphatase
MYVDLHLHLLPGTDDGPADEAGSLAFAARLAADGVGEATVTTHVGHPGFPVEIASIPARTWALQAALDGEGIPLRLWPGGEIHPEAAAGLRFEELEVIAHGPVGARWVLMEVPFAGVDAAFLAACRHIRTLGFGLLIAHPERAAGFAGRGLAMLRGELATGALLQVNACSLLGRHGAEPRRTAERLIASGLAYVVASDGHGWAPRDHSLHAGAERLLALGVSGVQTRRLTDANPRFLLAHGIPRQQPRDERSPWHPPLRRVRHAAAAALAGRRDGSGGLRSLRATEDGSVGSAAKR